MSYKVNNIYSIKFNLSQIRQRIFNLCLQTQNAKIFESQKLEFFNSVHKTGQRPPYVDIPTTKNRDDRAALCKMHISAHVLMNERGGHLKMSRNERYWPGPYI